MTPIPLILLLLAIGIVLLVAELLLPTHGMLGILGLLCGVGAIVVCFRINQWLGFGVFLGAIVASPFALALAMKIWAASPIGKRMILQNASVAPAPAPVRLGQVGSAVTEMRPMGECDFGDHRLEAVSELGIIPAGQQVKVVAIDNGRPTVRPLQSNNA
jgi:membrane-bound serine protease (ClpP class)